MAATPVAPIVATLAVPMRASHPAPAREVLAAADGRVGADAAHWALTAERLVMHLRARPGAAARVLSVSLPELARAMGDAIEREEAARLDRLAPKDA